jgi:hypothetical protein
MQREEVRMVALAKHPPSILAEDIKVTVMELFVVLVVELASAVALSALSAATTRSNMAFASAAVPDCWAAANPGQQNSTNAASADANKFLLMAFSLGRSGSSSYACFTPESRHQAFMSTRPSRLLGPFAVGHAPYLEPQAGQRCLPILSIWPWAIFEGFFRTHQIRPDGPTMSALLPKADVADQDGNVRFVPIADIGRP